jgi:pilus assembly protein CpaD
MGATYGFAAGTGRRLSGTGLALALGLAVAGCQLPKAGPVDFEQTHAIEPVPTTYVLATRFEPGSGKLSARDEDRLALFLRQYARRARSPLQVATTPDSAGLDAQEHMSAFREHLVFAGVPRRKIDIKPGSAPLGGEHSVVLSFNGWDVAVPECGDWSGDAGGWNPTNLPNVNYGCAYQRNIGLMLADPGDYIASEGDPYLDTLRTDGVIGLYRRGEATPAELPPSEITSLED